MTTITVTTNLDEAAGDSGAGGLASDIADGDGLSLREAIFHASAGDTITFDEILGGTTLTLTQGELAVAKSLTIDGDIDGDEKADITISGDNASRIFAVSGVNTDATLNSLTLTDGNGVGSVTNGGGAILVGTSVELTLNHSTVRDNSAQYGGGIHVTGNSSRLNVFGSTFIGNEATVSTGGGISVQSGAVASIVNTTLHGNSAAQNGGAIRVTAASVTVDNSTITDNEAGTRGGGIDATTFGSPTSLTLQNSVLAGNQAPNAVDISDLFGTGSPTISLSNSTVTSTAGFTVDSGAATLVADPGLGALQDNGGPVQTRALDPTSALIDAGDAILVVAGVTEDANGGDRVAGSEVDIGAVEAQLVVTSADDSDTVTTGGTAAENFRTDLNDGDGLTLREAIAHASSGNTITFADTLAGSTIRLTNGELVLDKDLIIDGDVDGDDKADITLSGDANNNGVADSGDSRIFNVTSTATVELNSLTLANGFADNYAANGARGGAIYVGGGTTLTLRHSTIQDSAVYANNGVLGYGGGVFGGGTVTITGSTIKGNAANSVASGPAYGGGLFVGSGQSLTLTNTTIHDNSSDNDGGGIDTGTNATLTINNSTITDNDAGGNTGGVNLYNGSTLNVTNSVLAGNTAGTGDQDLGETGSNDSTVNATNSFFGTNVTLDSDIGGDSQNNAGDPGLGALQDNGGAVQTRLPDADSALINAGTGTGPATDANGNDRVVGSGIDIGATEFQLVVTTDADEPFDNSIDSSLLDDLADGDGLSLREALFWARDGDMITFADTLAGSTIVLTQGELGISQDITIDGDIDGDNKADITISGDANNDGMANSGDSRIFTITNSDVTLRSLTLENGFASSGGAVSANSSSNLTIVDSTIRDSIASSVRGGAINAEGNATITNSLLTGNASEGFGGAVFVGSNGSLALTNTTLYDNSADTRGGGISTGSNVSLTVRNSTIVGNSTDGAGGGIEVFTDTTLSIANSVVAGNTATLADPDIFTFASSSLINAGGTFFGTTVGIDTDLSGNTQNGGDPGLGELLDHGGTTLTLSPLDGSALIDTGTDALVRADLDDVDDDLTTTELLPLDGRGEDRQNGTVDRGAVEKITNETIRGTDAANRIEGGAGSDTLFGGGGGDTILGGDAGDTIEGEEGNDTLRGNAGSDDIRGGQGGDDLFGGDGSDELRGNDGSDELFGNNGSDDLRGGDGSDTLNGGSGRDEMRGNAGNDTYRVDNTNDQVIETSDNGTDMVEASVSFTLGNHIEQLELTGNDAIDGTGNGLNNEVTGNDKKNTLLGQDGRDTLRGGDGGDDLRGGSGQDDLRGNDGNDTLRGGDGGDTLIGGRGNDTLIGQKGKDVMTGGGGRDSFVFDGRSHSGTTGSTRDDITDFSRGQNDNIDLSGLVSGNLDFRGDRNFQRNNDNQLRLVDRGDDIRIEIDFDGDQQSDFEIDVEDIGRLTQSDFLL
ncbi:MAG: choice-of-anchor Q domain-containing protein [Pseudomonadota bacterium]